MGGNSSKDGREANCLCTIANTSSSAGSSNRRKHTEVRSKPLQKSYPSYSSVKVRNSTFVMPSKYQNLKYLGHGAYGFVVDAEDATSHKHYAIKRMSHIFDQHEDDSKRILN